MRDKDTSWVLMKNWVKWLWTIKNKKVCVCV